MASNYKTPGVYVEEINSLPGIISRVPTAVPAFIGYTEKGPAHTPTKIRSMKEFTDTFGGGDDPETKVDINTLEVTYTHVHTLYDSMILYFRNGGGDCYVVSVGGYSALDIADFTDDDKGVKTLLKEDEPTLLVIPEAVNLSAAHFKTLQTAMVDHCAAMGDRFALLDLQTDEGGNHDPDTFRGSIVGTDLSYGAAYTPWLKTTQSLPVIDYSTIQLEDNGSNVDWWDGSNDSAILDLRDSIAIADELDTYVTGLGANLVPAANASASDDSSVETWITTILGVANKVFSYAAGGASAAEGPQTLAKIHGLITSQDANSLYTHLRTLASYILEEAAIPTSPARDEWTVGGVIDLVDDYNSATPHPITPVGIGYDYDLSGAGAAISNISGKFTFGDLETAAHPLFEAVYDDLKTIVADLQAELEAAVPVIEAEIDGGASGYFLSIVDTIKKSTLVLPPSPAMAGVISRIDRNRGVWKAPANTSLSGVEKTMCGFSPSDLGNLNVHPTGKSINAIREFRGKGIIVYGARTLDGNSNEWRYISVRRLFLMAEESIQQALESVVFDSNDEKTWVRVKGMVENFLNGLWRDGALSGSSPEQAYFVKVGLNQTMNATDILEGRLIVEIGLAAVRPAEFIITRFSHKLPEA